MKKILLAMFVSIFSISSAQSQELIIKYQFKTPEEKTKLALDKIKSYKLAPDANEKTAKVLGEFYKEQQKMLDGAIKNGVGNVQAYKAKKAKQVTERDDKLKKIFSKEQFVNWVTVVEPSLSSKKPVQNTAAVKN